MVRVSLTLYCIYIRILRQRSYILWNYSLSVLLYLNRRSPSVVLLCRHTAPSSSILQVSYLCVVLDSSMLVRSSIVLSLLSCSSSISVCAPIALLLKYRMEGLST
jgi:hypothetical protein